MKKKLSQTNVSDLPAVPKSLVTMLDIMLQKLVAMNLLNKNLIGAPLFNKMRVKFSNATKNIKKRSLLLVLVLLFQLFFKNNDTSIFILGCCCCCLNPREGNWNGTSIFIGDCSCGCRTVKDAENK